MTLLHLLSIEQINEDFVADLFNLATILKPIAQGRKASKIFNGAVLGNIFFEPSTRTRISFSSAFSRLGGSVIEMTDSESSSISKGESIEDMSRVISGYLDIVVMRCPENDMISKFAKKSIVPVINAGDGSCEHPSQALIDVYTMKKEFSMKGKNINGSHIVCIGDLKNGRAVHSFIKLIIMLYREIRFTFVPFCNLHLPDSIVDEIRCNNVFQVKKSILDVHDADTIYVTRLQKERLESNLCTDYFQINQKVLNVISKQDTIIMHPLPRDCGSFNKQSELSTELDNDSRLVIFKQAHNALEVRMAIFSKLLQVETMIEKSMYDVFYNSIKYCK